MEKKQEMPIKMVLLASETIFSNKFFQQKIILKYTAVIKINRKDT